MRHATCFCPGCGHYNAEAGVEVSRLADEVARLEDVLCEIAGFADERDGDWAAMHALKSLREATITIVRKALETKQ